MEAGIAIARTRGGADKFRNLQKHGLFSAPHYDTILGGQGTTVAFAGRLRVPGNPQSASVCLLDLVAVGAEYRVPELAGSSGSEEGLGVLGGWGREAWGDWQPNFLLVRRYFRLEPVG